MKNVKCQAKVSQVSLDLDRLVALGLLITELVTNSAKHAFTESEGGNINITLEQDDSSHLTLTVQDDGRGLPAGMDLVNGKSLGMRIMNSLSAQLEGELSWIEVPKGTAARLVFPLMSSDAMSTPDT